MPSRRTGSGDDHDAGKVVRLREPQPPTFRPWWDAPLLAIHPHARPKGVKAWVKAAWYCDLFFGRVPAFKAVMLFAVLVSRC